MELRIIAYAQNGFADKFGIPRQSREESTIQTRIVFTDEFRNSEALRGIDAYSHLWLIWGADKVTTCPTNQKSDTKLSWSPTVRPPRLGGNKRMGVFATRSPFRPNPIGLTSVKLIGVEQGDLIVTGADLMNGTPIYDIKPYLSFSDSHPDAINGFAEETKDYQLQVVWETDDVEPKLKTELTEILQQDPRPAYHNDSARVYTLDYAGAQVRFRVDGEKLLVVSCRQSNLL
ncbi:MAG: tRNA (N6-threonylcarbamoyladenosine(37)-N6)-methyltransferase TrmO [Paludibacteraceae bacterium]|nr:tRNA (N6-threonylcarbamoyladenosine(37)-N6)-methyltransferase TrmO [Paludibacteraceae bacterium]